MGTRIITNDFVGDSGLGFDPLVRRGLQYLNFFGGTADKTGRNLAGPGRRSGNGPWLSCCSS